MSQNAPRPGQATFAAWLIIGGSVILVLTAWQRISTLHTLEAQEELQRVLSEPPLSGTGVGLEGLKTTIRVLCMVAAAAATASAILGVQALQKSTSARLALTLLAPLVLVGGFATRGFFAPLVVAGVAMLWLRPTRDWFAGRPWLPASASTPSRRHDPFAVQPREGIDTPAKPEAPVVPPAPPAQESRPTTQPGPHSSPYGAPLPETPEPEPAVSPYAPAKRPGALISACVIVWVSSALVSGMMLLLSLVMAVARDDFFAELERQQADLDTQGMTEADLATGTFVMTAIILVWSVAASVLAVLAIRRQQWARIALVVSTAVVGLLLLAATLVNPLLVVLLGAALVTVWLLLRSDVSAWFKR
ncbi:hypothetical protein [Nocardioides antri]|uniref:DUF4064 domain-containing protein n=1 Tax=Nocardioides antri TaxID=2607659 RepID=A0A5B1M539_9ACTN|nr:hypothetical protein [Nocardioides antri]KAA1427588.1 hypothetical protein F0U47_09040 [Nocardioides antri]